MVGFIRYLVIGAHFDDEIIGVGGTILKKIAQCDVNGESNLVFVCILTDSSSTQYKGDEEIKNEKIQIALDLHNEMGIAKTYYFNLPDMQLDTVPLVKINEC